MKELIARAVAGDEQATGVLLEHYRGYLRILAQRQFDRRLQSRVDPSDVVQQTLLEAVRDLSAFRGACDGEFAAWLRRILEHNVAQTVQTHLVAQKRSCRRESSLDETLDGVALCDRIPLPQSSPSRRAMRGEDAVRLAKAIDSMLADQAEAIRLRYLEGYSLAELAQHFQRSEVAVAGLLKRGLRRLRELLAESG